MWIFRLLDGTYSAPLGNEANVIIQYYLIPCCLSTDRIILGILFIGGFQHILCLFRCANPNVHLSTQRGPSQLTSLAVGHPKLAKLEEIILDHFVRFQDENADDPEASTRVIIFSEYRDSVNEITEILNQHRPIVRVMSFIGHSSTGRASKGFSQKDQLKVVHPLFIHDEA